MNEADHISIRNSMVNTNYKGVPIVNIVISWLIKNKFPNACVSNDVFLMIFDNDDVNGFFTYNGVEVDIQEFKKKNLECINEFTIINCIIGINNKYHATVIIINNLTDKLEYYDPHGSTVSMDESEFHELFFNNFIDEKITKLAQDLELTRDIPPPYCGTQTISSYQNSTVKDIGFCLVHVYLIIMIRLMNGNLSIMEVTTGMIEFALIDINGYIGQLAYLLSSLVHQIAEYYEIKNLDLMEINKEIPKKVSLDDLYYQMIHNIGPFASLTIPNIQDIIWFL